ncbi:MAG: hypothetical protein FWJ83_01120 [Limnochordales bacterium]|nr:MAG: hypothetical protein DIU83_07630 [Bacillota bacterium]
MPAARAPFPRVWFVFVFILSLAAGAGVALGQSDEPAWPTIEEIVARAEAELSAIRRVELIVELEQYNATDGSITPGRGKLTAKMPDLFRFDWLQPDMMAGSILMVDRARNEAHQYNPIREEIIVQRWDRLAAQQNLVPDIDRWLALPDPEDYDIEFGGVATVDGTDLYVVLARPKAAPQQLYEFLVHPETWLVTEFRFYDSPGRLALRGLLKDVRINGDLPESAIRELPPARIRHL